jgi:uncharacterized protein YaiL (DUF2058 family)
MSSLRDQLLKAGFVSKKQVKKSEIKPKIMKDNTNPPHKKQIKRNKPKRELSDLEKFYRQRSSAENKERQQQKKAKEEATQLKKERNTKISRIINENMLSTDKATERYNFVIGTAVKYMYVSPKQLDELANGTLALTFLKGKCRVISIETAQKIREIDAKRLIVQQKISNEDQSI